MPFKGYIEIDGVEHAALIDYDYEAPEYNWGERVEVTEVIVAGKNIVDSITDEQEESLESQCWDDLRYLGDRAEAMAEARAEAMREARYERTH